MLLAPYSVDSVEVDYSDWSTRCTDIAQKAEVAEKKKDAMRAIITALKFQNLDVSVAGGLMAKARSNLDELLKQKLES